ncbi:MAG: succinylglutamate desuccinylase/aspartoacylase family protein [Planctomycetaceae bacterium]|nr:succinylglutamate desuccinylase/aspartoacylase family protein [Planctomycetaceae bacterium]MCB9951187.1 succinylglutamate desuccinylase/aspartoacylase family protein [Planctomycetaceae bacterium]
MSKRFSIGGVTVRRGETLDVRLKISETYTGEDVSIPVRIIRAKQTGPSVFVSAAIHGDEIVGTGIVHDLLSGEPAELRSGTLVLIPVVNVFGFENHDRYLPDRRDLNRSFPGSISGSLTNRIAHKFMSEIVHQCNFGIDLHAASQSRTNFPNVRGDLSRPEVRRLAKAFGCELVVNGKGPEGSLRYEACKAGCPTIILEAGEPLKVEAAMLEIGVRGVCNVLRELGMLPGELERPPFQYLVNKTTWVRAEVGGLLKFHTNPGEVVREGQALASNFGILGDRQNIIRSPVDGIILGMTTLPAVKPGEPIVHIAIPGAGIETLEAAVDGLSPDDLHGRVRSDLATNTATHEDPDHVRVQD